MKKFIAILLSAFMLTSLFAQKAETFGVTDTDCKNYAKNYEKILDEIDLDSDDFNPKKKYTKEEKILEKYGITGPNRLGKIYTINMVITIESYEKYLDADTMAIMKAYNIDPMAEMKANISKKRLRGCKEKYESFTASSRLCKQLNS